MLQEPNTQSDSPNSQDDSDQDRPSSFFAGDVKLDKTDEPKSLGEIIGAERKRELLKNKEKEKETFEGGAYVREKVAAGIKQEEERVQQESVEKQSPSFRQPEQLVKDQQQAQVAEGADGRAERELEQQNKQLEGKFERAKRTLSDLVRSSGREVRSKEENIKRLEKNVDALHRDLDAVDDKKQSARHDISELERDLDEFKKQKKQFEAVDAKDDKDIKFDLRRVTREITDTERQLRNLNVVTKGRSTESSVSRKLDQSERELEKLHAQRKELLDRQKEATALVGAWQSAKSKPDLKRSWHDFENDLKSLGIHVV